MFTAIAAGAFLGEVMTRRRWAGMAIACTGSCLIALAGNGGIALERGALLVLGAAVAQAAFFVAQKPLLRRYVEPRADDLGDGARRADDAAARARAARRDRLGAGRRAIAVAFLGLGASAIGFVAWAYACAHIDVSIAAATLYAVPLVAIAVGWAWLGEMPRPVTVLGGAIALAGVALATRRQPLRGRPKPRSISSACSPSVPRAAARRAATAAP